MTELVHGKPSTYNNHKCRCDACRAAWADYIRDGGYVKRYQERERQKKLQEKLQQEPKTDILNDLGILDVRFYYPNGD